MDAAMTEPLANPSLPSLPDQSTETLKPVRLVESEQAISSRKLPEEIGSYLKYVAEDDRTYLVRSRSRRMLEVLKRRSSRAAYPPAQPGPLQPAFRWLTLAAAGLALSGLGALLLAPFAIAASLRAQKGQLSPADQARARLVVILAGLIMAFGAGLTYLFWLHVRG
jgi:hypothetical protein